MNLAWIAAVLRPYDVAPHPNFRDTEYDRRGPAGLAAIVMGDVLRMRASGWSPVEEGVGWADAGLRYAWQSLQADTIREGLAGLRAEAAASAPDDPARSCALALLACSAAAELEDYDVCDAILEPLLSRPADNSSAERLLRAALLQQRSLRLWDSGRRQVESSVEVARLVTTIDPRECPHFPLSPGVSGSYTDTLTHIVQALQRAAWSTLRSGFERPPETVGVPPLPEQVRAPAAEQLLWLAEQREDAYSKLLNSQYKQLFRSQAQELFSSVVPDLFYPTLGLELLGHAAVYPARKEVALMRLVQASTNPYAAWGDALRLLRHAGASTELDLAVERLRTSGPLTALSEDARQILLQRAKPTLLRTVELRVLRAAAELMTPAEAHRALATVLEVVAAGGPPDFPGSWQRPASRLGESWLTAATLANAAGAEHVGRVADLLLEAASAPPPDEPLWDPSIGRALRQLDWSKIPEHSGEQWARWLTTAPDSMPTTAEVVAAKSSAAGVYRDGPVASLSDAANRLNAAMHGAVLSTAEITTASRLTREALARIRASAAVGTHNFGSVNVADIAAALIIYGAADDLWDDLTAFLSDGRVARADRSPAYARLAQERPSLPPVVADQFRRTAHALLMTPDQAGIPDDQVTPYPELLRFLASLDLLDEASTSSLIAQLAGSAEVTAREQAARTVAALATRRTNPWILALAMQLSHDAEVAVKAQAGRALALLVSSDPTQEASISERLIELLREDGVLVPLVVLREFGPNTSLPDRVLEEIRRLSVAHPSRFVRDQTSALPTREG